MGAFGCSSVSFCYQSTVKKPPAELRVIGMPVDVISPSSLTVGLHAGAIQAVVSFLYVVIVTVVMS